MSEFQEGRAFDDEFNIVFSKHGDSLPFTDFKIGEQHPCMDPYRPVSLKSAFYKIYQPNEMDQAVFWTLENRIKVNSFTNVLPEEFKGTSCDTDPNTKMQTDPRYINVSP